MRRVLTAINLLPNWAKILISLLLLLTAYLLFFVKDVKLKSQTEIENLEKENSRLNGQLFYLNSEIKSKQEEIDYLYDGYAKFNKEKVEKQINQKYETKKNNVRNLPIDSTISDLADWLK